MNQFLKTFAAILARWRVLYAVSIINHKGATIQDKIKTIWMPGQLEEIAIIEIRVRMLLAQIEVISIYAKRSLDSWNEKYPQNFQVELNAQTQSPYFHNLILSIKEQRFLEQLESVNIYNSELEKHYEGLNLLADLPKDTLVNEELARNFLIQAISFNGYLEMIRNTDAYNKQSVQNLLELLNS